MHERIGRGIPTERHQQQPSASNDNNFHRHRATHVSDAARSSSPSSMSTCQSNEIDRSSDHLNIGNLSGGATGKDDFSCKDDEDFKSIEKADLARAERDVELMFILYPLYGM